MSCLSSSPSRHQRDGHFAIPRNALAYLIIGLRLAHLLECETRLHQTIHIDAQGAVIRSRLPAHAVDVLRPPETLSKIGAHFPLHRATRLAGPARIGRLET